LNNVPINEIFTGSSINRSATITRKPREPGDPEGEKRTLTYFNVSKEELTKFAQLEIDKLKFTGSRGKITVFGTPVVRHGDRVQLIDKAIPDRNGLYLCAKVETTFGLGRYRQQIELGPKV